MKNFTRLSKIEKIRLMKQRCIQRFIFLFILLAGLIGGNTLLAQTSFHTVIFSGNSTDFNSAEKFTAAAGATDYYIAFDATYMYFGAFATGGDIAAVNNFTIYIDTDPRNSLLTGNGSASGKVYNGVTPTLPFNADYTSHTEQDYTDPIYKYNAGWATTGVSPFYWSGANYREVRIALSDIGNPASVYVCLFMGYAGGIYSSAPGLNVATSATPAITGFFGSFPVYKAGVNPVSFRTQNITAANGGGTAISNFSVASGSSITAGDYGDITISDVNGTSNLLGNTSITGTLFINPSTTSNTPKFSMNGFTLTVGGSGIGGTAGRISVNGNSGTPIASGSNGTIAFLGNGSFVGANTQPSLTLIPSGSTVTTGGALNIGAIGGATLKSAISGTLQINTNGSIITNAPNYQTGSTLIYNTGSTYTAGTEWTTNSASAQGVPYTVTIGNSTALNFGASAAYRYAAGLVTIGSGSSITLSSAIGGDLRIAAGLTNNNNGVGVGINTNGRALQTMGTGTYTKTGTDNLDYLIIGSANTLTLATGANLSLTNSGATGCLQFNAAGTLTMAGTNTVSIVAGGSIMGTAAGSILGSSPTTSILSLLGACTVNPSAALGVGTSVGIQVNGGLTITTAARLSAGYVQINQSGYVAGNPIVYYAGSTLVYNHSSGTYGVQAFEWPSATGPVNVTVNNNGTSTGITFATNNVTARTIAGTLTLNQDIDLSGTGTPNLTTLNTIANETATVKGSGNFTHSANGSFTTANALGINGTLTTSGTKTLPATTSFTFNGSALGQVTGALIPATINNLTISNATSGSSTATPAVLLSGSTAVSGTLTFTAGHFSINGKTLTANGAITINTANKLVGTSSSNFIVGGSGTITATSLFGSSGGGALNDFTINRASTTITAGSPVTVSGTFSLTNGALAMSTNTFTLNGAISLGSGTLTAASTPLVIGGNGAITGSLTATATPLAFSGITMNRSGATLTLGSNATVSNATGLTLTAGNIALGAFNLTNTNTAGTLGTGSSGAMIVATGAGKAYVTIPITGFIAQTFPIGDGTNYSPASLTFTANTVSGTLGVNVTASAHPQLNLVVTQSNYIKRYWSVTTTGLTSYTYSSTFTYVPGDIVGTQNLMKLNRYTGSAWVEDDGSTAGANVLTSTTGLTQTTGLLNGNDFTGRKGPSSYTWNGSASNEWTTPANWTPSGPPTSADNVIIGVPGSFTNCSINSGSITIGSVTLNSTGVLNMASGTTLNISGAFNYDGSGGATATLNAGSTVNMTSSAAQTVPALNYGTLNLTGGDRTLASSGIIGIAGSYTPSGGTTTNTGSTLNFNRTSGIQTIPIATYNNLTVSTTGGNATAGGAITVNSVLNVPSGSTFDMSTFALSGASLTTSGTGILKTQNTGTPIPTGRTWTMEVQYTGASGQTIMAGTYGNLSLSGAGTKTIAASTTLTVNGTLTNNSTLVLTAGTSSTNTFLYIKGDLTNNNGATITSTATYTRFYFSSSNAQTFTNNGTVTSPVTSFDVFNTNASGLTLAGSNSIIVARANLFTGTVFNSAKLTIGTGTTAIIQRGVSSATAPAGIFDVNPTFIVSPTGLSLLYSTGSIAYSTGYEVPATLSVGSVAFYDAADVTMNTDLTIAGTPSLTFSTGTPVFRIGAHTLTLGGTITYTVAGSLYGGLTSNLVMNAATTLNAITNGLNNFTINAATTLGGAVTVNGTLALKSGAFTNSTNLTMATGATISRTGGSLSANPIFGSAVNVIYGDGTYTTPLSVRNEIMYTFVEIQNVCKQTILINRSIKKYFLI